jgi:hypothetical protein
VGPKVERVHSVISGQWVLSVGGSLCLNETTKRQAEAAYYWSSIKLPSLQGDNNTFVEGSPMVGSGGGEPCVSGVVEV